MFFFCQSVDVFTMDVNKTKVPTNNATTADQTTVVMLTNVGNEYIH